MRTLSVELDEETVQALEVERSLIGFESRAEYVRWIVEHRAAIDQGAETGQLLSAYSDRITDLESRLEAIETDSDGTDDNHTDAVTVDSSTSPPGPASDETGQRPRTSADGGWTQPAESDTMDGPTLPDSDRTSGEIEATNLRPERVERVRDETLAEDAGVLGSVEGDRLDELSRRAVAKTRSRLNRDVETGLEYRSKTSLAETSSDVRPGADVTDLDALTVPGYDEEIVAARRELVGKALAYLRDEGDARKSDFVDALFDENPAGYDSTGGWWRCLKGALKEVEAVSGGDGSRIWRYGG